MISAPVREMFDDDRAEQRRRRAHAWAETPAGRDCIETYRAQSTGRVPMAPESRAEREDEDLRARRVDRALRPLGVRGRGLPARPFLHPAIPRRLTMSAIIHDIRPFQSAIDQARKAHLGPNATHAVIRAVKREQRAGRDGKAVAGELQRSRLRGEQPTPPEAA